MQKLKRAFDEFDVVKWAMVLLVIIGIILALPVILN